MRFQLLCVRCSISRTAVPIFNPACVWLPNVGKLVCIGLHVFGTRVEFIDVNEKRSGKPSICAVCGRRRCVGWAQCSKCPRPDVDSRAPRGADSSRCAPRPVASCPVSGAHCPPPVHCCPNSDCTEFLPFRCDVVKLYIYTYIHTNLHSAKNRENDSEALSINYLPY